MVSSELLETLTRFHLLEPAQLAELGRRLQGRSVEARSLAQDLIKRGWLTPYQVNQLFRGRGKELVLGPYVVLSRIGEGGMGTVFKARHQKIGRVAALKVIRKERLQHPEALKRFHREVRASAQLNHPNIVLAFDADEVDGTTFLAMEYVEGTDLARLVKEQGPLPVALACEYVRQAALGLQHAHEKGLVHRDIKPSNLLVQQPPAGQPGSRPVVKVLDLGLARLDAVTPGEDSGPLTRTGVVMGTPDYLAPEQARQSHTVDIRADLYSLGCTLYFLLTGQVPFPGSSVMEKLVKHQVAEPVPVEQLRPEVPAPIAAVVRRLMAKKPEDRYQTPAELADVLAEGGRPALLTPSSGTGFTGAGWPKPAPETLASSDRLQATPVSGQAEPALSPTEAWVQAVSHETLEGEQPAAGHRRRQAAQTRRRRLLLGGASGLAVAGLAILTWLLLHGSGSNRPQPRGSEVEPDAVSVAANEPWKDTGIDVEAGQRVVLFPRGVWGKGPLECPARGLDQLPRDRNVLPEAPFLCLLARVGDEPVPLPVLGRLVFQPLRSGRLFLQVNDLDRRGNSGRLRVEIDGGTRSELVVPAPEPSRVEAAEAAWRPLAEQAANPGPVSPKFGRQLLGFQIRHGGTPQAMRAAVVIGEVLAKLPAPLDGLRPADIPEYEQAAAGDGDPARAPPGLVAVLGDSRLKHWADIYALAYSPDGKILASAGADRTIRLWESAGGKLVRVLSGHKGRIHSLAFSPDGALLASASEDQTVRLWNPASGKELHSLAARPTYGQGLAFQPGGELLASANNDGSVLLWQIPGGKLLRTLTGHKNTVRSVAFSPDGKLLVSGGEDRTVRLWDPDTGKELGSLPDHEAGVRALAFRPDGKILATGQEIAAGNIKLWDLATRKEAGTLTESLGHVYALAFRKGGQQLASSRWAGGSLWDLATGMRAGSFSHPANVFALAFHPEGRMLASGSADGSVKLWDADTYQELLSRSGPTSSLHGVAFRPGGESLAAVGMDGFIRLWDSATGKELLRRDAQDMLYALAISPDGITLACGGHGGSVQLWEAGRGKKRRTLSGHLGHLLSLAYRGDGRMLASGNVDSTVKLWEPATGKELRTLLGHEQQTQSVAFRPDGLALASGSWDGTARIWEPATGKQLHVLTDHHDHVTSVTFSPDGKLLATGGSDGTVRLWNSVTGKSLTVLRGHGRNVVTTFRPDGQMLAAASDDGMVRLWDLATRSEKQALRVGPPGGKLGIAFSPDGRHLATANGNGTIYVLRLAPPPGKANP